MNTCNFRNLKISIVKNSPIILIGAGIIGMISATVTAVAATPKALASIDKQKEALEVDELPPKELVKSSWKFYVPTVALTVTSAACIIGGAKVNVKRNAALMTAYGISEAAAREYRNKVIETIGEKAESDIREEVAVEKAKNHPLGDQGKTSRHIFSTGKGETLCYDTFSGRYFLSDMEYIRKSINDLNSMLLKDGVACLNDWYEIIKLDPVKTGYEIGWRADNSMIDPAYGSLLTEIGVPCMTVDLYPTPRYGYEY